MADDDANTGTEDGGADLEGLEEGGKGKKKIFILLGVVVFILLGAGAGLYFSGALDTLLKKEEAPAADVAAAPESAKGAQGCVKDENGKETCPPSGAQFLKMPDMIVNLDTEGGAPRYLRLAVQLEFRNASDMAAVEKVMPRVVDQFQTYLREMRVRDLRGSAGIYRLQMELLSRVNEAAYPVEVQGVLFQEILIQ